MGKLFWKFFFIFWLAQVLTGLGVGLAVWTLRIEQLPIFSDHMQNGSDAFPLPAPSQGRYDMPPPQGMLDSLPPHRSGYNGFMPPLLPIFAGSVVSLIFAAWLAWYFARPIRNLRAAFDEVAKGKLDTRIGSTMGGRKDELADLGQDFDHMASRLQSLMEVQRRLLHDISHELRSPLARLQAATDLMQQQPERAAEFISRLERDIGRIDVLVDEMLTLARLDSGMAGRMDEIVDLHELIEQIADDARFEAAIKQSTVEVSLPEHVTIKGNHELFFRALENVVRNAVRHSPAGKPVDVSVKQEASMKWAIIVSDTGPGVPPSELEMIFDPFFRSKTGSDFSGYGLGLAITQRVVQAHGGTVAATNRPEGGLAVTITLPAL